MKDKKTLQELNSELGISFRDQAYDECRGFSLEKSESFIKKYPFFSQYKDIIAKIIFTSSSQKFLQTTFKKINGIHHVTERTHLSFLTLIKKNLLASASLFQNLFRLSSLILIPKYNAPRIGVELSEGLRPHHFRSDLSFDPDELGCENIVLFDFQNVVLRYKEDELKILRECLEKGTLLVSNQKHCSLKNSIHINVPTIKKFDFNQNNFNLLTLLGYFPFIKISEIFWYFLFKKLYIKGWLHTVEIHLENLVQVNVMRKLNGVSFSRQRSEQGSVKGLFYQPGDVLLNWSHHTNEHFQSLNFYKVIKPVGHYYLNHKNWDEYISFGASVRSRFPAGSFIISLFDNLVGDNFELSTENFNLLVSYLLDLIKQNPKIKLTFKLKKKHSVNQYPFIDEIEKNIQNGNILLFDGYLLPANIGLGSDLSIGTGASSTIFEINIAKKKGIFFWPGPNKNHILSKVHFNNLICRTMDEIKNHVEDVLNNPDSKVGILSLEDAKAFNEYNDYYGPQRSAFCFKKLLENGMDRANYLLWLESVDMTNIH